MIRIIRLSNRKIILTPRTALLSKLKMNSTIISARCCGQFSARTHRNCHTGVGVPSYTRTRNLEPRLSFLPTNNGLNKTAYITNCQLAPQFVTRCFNYAILLTTIQFATVCLDHLKSLDLDYNRPLPFAKEVFVCLKVRELSRFE